ncbi:MAG: sensor histidine kinase, partial [Lachnospiraceae bacterium]|nr:sensor histidine kinase [Lachnospiraceae bacterium]
YPPQKIINFQVAYGIPENVADGFQLDGGYSRSDEYYNIVNHSYVEICYVSNLILLLVLLVLMTSNKVLKEELTFTRRGKQYFLEIAVFLGAPMLVAFSGLYGQFVAELGMLVQYGNTYNNPEWIQFFTSFLGMLMILACDYVTLLYIRPVFTLGLVDYIKEYSLLYRMWKGIKGLCVRGMESLKQVDLSEKASKTIFKFVAVNFVILGIMMCMWFMGIFGLLIYSIVLFFLIKKYYGQVVNDYAKALNMTKRIASGEFTQEAEEEFGIFNSLKEELCRIEDGFQKAVEQETKSQRMKTELITNVSHDLKTPLTAITTYVELLKKEDITEEERREYIDTLSRKSLRLKVLIEDLFEVSKASSQNIVLQYMDVDVVNLMKQVYIEHEEKLSNMGLDIRWNVPDEKIILLLDNQKTYRIFENLFVNIQKYALPNSRVYIDILQVENQVQIVMKNISASELNVRPEELTERFVRGDQSRNTEGSGLGLAIAKSFVEAQKGSFEIVVDGDLFKAVITFFR